MKQEAFCFFYKRQAEARHGHMMRARKQTSSCFIDVEKRMGWGLGLSGAWQQQRFRTWTTVVINE
jgi:hypothetical protein